MRISKIAAIAALACIASPVVAGQYSMPSAISFETLEIDYGFVEKGGAGVREFKFRNTGNSPLLIVSAVPSCGCVQVGKPSAAIMPGAFATIRVTYDTQRVGSFTKYITLETNAPDNLTVRLKIFGTINAQPA